MSVGVKAMDQSRWTKADENTISLLTPLIELRVENGERIVRFEPNPRYVEFALHLGFDKKDARTKFRFVTLRQALLVQDFPHLMRPVKDAGAHGRGLEATKEDRQILGGPNSMCSAISSPARGGVVDSEGGQ